MEICECGGELHQLRLFENELALEAEADISRIIVALTRSAVPREFTNGDYRSLISHATSRMGLEGKAGRADFKAWICEQVGLEQVTAWRISFSKNGAFVRGARGTQSCRHPAHNAILIKALFGDFDGFEMALREARINTRERESTIQPTESAISNTAPSPQRNGPSAERMKRIAYWSALPRADFGAKKQAMRRRVIELKEQDPEAGRTRLGYWTRVFLAHFDGKWYDRNLPPRDTQLWRVHERLMQLGVAQTAEEKAAEIRETRRQLDELRPPRRISVTMLWGPMATYGATTNLKKNPVVLCALKECEESPDEWSERNAAIWCSKVAERFPDSHYADLDAFAGLSAKDRFIRLRNLRTWLWYNVKK